MAKGYSTRKTRVREQVTMFLIICEGQKTERLYFNKYRKRNNGLMILTPNTNVTDPRNLVKFAISQIQRYGIDFDYGDQVWCVFDADNNTPANLAAARQSAELSNINLCLSNPCFELWYLLHYTYYYTPISTSNLLQKLTNYIPNYNKSKEYFESLFDKRGGAIINARKLNRQHSDLGVDLLSLDSNPSTFIVELVQQILDNEKKNEKRFTR